LSALFSHPTEAPDALEQLAELQTSLEAAGAPEAERSAFDETFLLAGTSAQQTMYKTLTAAARGGGSGARVRALAVALVGTHRRAAAKV
jgi:hypothetical protein